MHSLCIVVDLHVAFNNIKPFCVAMETQEWVKFLLLSSYKIFRTSVYSINILTSSCKASEIVVLF